MRYVFAIVLLMVAALVRAGDRIVDFEKSDKEMNAAIAKARASLEDFFTIVDTLPSSATGFTVKVRIAHGNDVEHIWIKPFRKKGNEFVGTLANEPDDLPGLHLGQEISFKRSEITDWGYEVGSKKKGFFTVCVIFKHMPADEVRQYQQDGFEC
jgi:uncharacterized protein YegJ (DUF2314 family)